MCVNVCVHIKGSRPEWCISSMIYSRDTPFWSETLDMRCAWIDVYLYMCMYRHISPVLQLGEALYLSDIQMRTTAALSTARAMASRVEPATTHGNVLCTANKYVCPAETNYSHHHHHHCYINIIVIAIITVVIILVVVAVFAVIIIINIIVIIESSSLLLLLLLFVKPITTHKKIISKHQSH